MEGGEGGGEKGRERKGEGGGHKVRVREGGRERGKEGDTR